MVIGVPRKTDQRVESEPRVGVPRVEPAQLAFLLLTIALGVMVAIDAGLEVNVAAARAAALKLLAPTSGR